MSASNLIRVGGLAAVLAGALLLIADLWSLLLEVIVGGSENFSEFAVTPSWTVLSAMYLLGSLLLLVALIGLYARQSETAGTLGLAGFLVALVGTGLLVEIFWTQAFVVPSAAKEAPAFLDAEEMAGPLDMGFMLLSIVVAVGWALFGLATLRARVLPRRAAIVLIIGALLTALPLPATTLVIEVAVAWLGLSLLSGQGRTTAETSSLGAQPRVQ
jgi:hypothetical protein